MNELEVWDGVTQLMKNDKEYQQCVSEILECEPDYLALKDFLTPLQWEQLERYISACETADDYRMFLAYQLGVEHGKKAGLTVIMPAR